MTSLDTDGTINVTQSNNPDSVMNILGTNTTITLGTSKLTASGQAPAGFYDIKSSGSTPIIHSDTYSSLAFDGNVVINSSYDGTNIGQIVVDGYSSQSGKPSTLNMGLPQTTLTIYFDTKGNVAQPNTFLTLLSATNKAVINMPDSAVEFQALNSNVTTTWVGAYDEATQTYKISGTTVTPQTPPNTPSNVVSVINFLTTPAITTQNSDGTTTTSFSDAQLSALAASGSVSTIADFIRNATALVVQAMRAADANKEASDESNRAMMNRASSLGGFSANDILTQADGLGTSAGDNEAKHGVWMNGFMEQSIQKKMDDNSGYKARGFGGTLGADTKITDDVVMGVAWTTAHAIIKQRDDITGNKTTVATNIFSIYGLKILPNNWALEADVSGGINNARNTSVRYNGGHC